MRTLATQFTKFAGIGVIGTAAHYVTLISLVQATGANAVLASSIGAIIGAIVNYFLNYHFTFQSSKRHHEAITKFFAVATVGFFLNGILMAALTTSLGIYYLLAQVITTGLVLVWNFAGNRYWTFRIPPVETGSEVTDDEDIHRR
jgi:putative flippase GtrA